MDDNLFKDAPDHVRARAASTGRHYFWAVETDAGEVYYENERDNFVIGNIPGVVTLDKPTTDPWNSIVLGNIKSAAWIPASSSESAFRLSRTEAGASHLSIFRKNIHTTFGLHYISYVMGLRWDEEMRERHVHICPPCRYMKKGQVITFPGGVDVITTPGEMNSFEKFTNT